MKSDVKIGIFLYALADYLTAGLTWFLFLWYRKHATQSLEFGALLHELSEKDIWMTLLLIPILWVIMHLFSGAYFKSLSKVAIY
jgi:hypothetical protein